jgi:hypothetical protein
VAAGPTEQINEAAGTGANSAFFYDRIGNNKERLIRGSRSGLQRIAQLICEHVGRRAGERFGSNIRSRACAIRSRPKTRLPGQLLGHDARKCVDDVARRAFAGAA